MTLATKNNAIILKDGKLAEDCACCGGWYCVDIRGCCVINCATSLACESDCIAAGGVFLGEDMPCSITPYSPPSSLVVTLSGTVPAIEACDPTVVISPPFGSVTSNKDIFYGTQWGGTYTLTRTANPDVFMYARNVLLSTGEPQVTVTLQCAFDAVNKRFVSQCSSILAGVSSPTSITSGGTGARYRLLVTINAIGGNSASGFVVPGNAAAVLYEPVLTTPPTFCSSAPPSTLSGVTVSAISVG